MRLQPMRPGPLLIFLFGLLTATEAAACTYFKLALKESFKRASAVFTGEVVSVIIVDEAPLHFRHRKVVLRVTESFKAVELGSIVDGDRLKSPGRERMNRSRRLLSVATLRSQSLPMSVFPITCSTRVTAQSCMTPTVTVSIAVAIPIVVAGFLFGFDRALPAMLRHQVGLFVAFGVLQLLVLVIRIHDEALESVSG